MFRYKEMDCKNGRTNLLILSLWSNQILKSLNGVVCEIFTILSFFWIGMVWWNCNQILKIGMVWWNCNPISKSLNEVVFEIFTILSLNQSKQILNWNGFLMVKLYNIWSIYKVFKYFPIISLLNLNFSFHGVLEI